MYQNKTVAVVVPAYNEEKQIGMVIESMPDFVDRVIIVNDSSTDKTVQMVLKYIKQDNGNHKNGKIGRVEVNRNKYNEAEIVLQENGKKELGYYVPSEVINNHPETSRIILINNLVNSGVGASIARGYKWAKDNNIDCTAVMAGDGQMDPAELESICKPVIEEGIDYVKGNRLIHRSAKYVIPKKRFLGNSILSILTKIASGYWRVSDTQTGYTAISLNALQAIDIYKIYKRYGMPNDLLVKLNVVSCTLREVKIKPVYRVGENSKMKINKVVPTISWLLLKCFFKRIWVKYFLRDFHPIFLLYHFSFILGAFSVPYFLKILKAFMFGQTMNYEPLLAFIFLFASGFQALFFAMWMDILDNDRLYK